jgi:hypothetical protein
MRRYRIQDDGYATASFKFIYRDRERRSCGRVVRNDDGTFTAHIDGVSEPGETEHDAFLQAWATRDGLDLSEVHRALFPRKKVQADTEVALDWLKANAAENDGHLEFRNADLARVLGWPKPNQPLGNLISRLDCACCRAGLPSIGCAAVETFKDAWRGNRKRGRAWDFPIPLMRRRSSTHHWSSGDFELLKRETRSLGIGSGRAAWGDEFAKREARVRAWAETGEAHG